MTQLPIDPHLDGIVKKITGEKPVILMASPGSGKTTRVPAHLLKAIKGTTSRKIIVIVPKRVSALSAADRIASENNWVLGDEVGYQVRFENKVTAKTQLIFMTEGLFLKRIQTPGFWDEIHTLIIDEFHERSSSIDMILGLGFEQKVLGHKLQLVIMSATLNVQQLKTFLGDSETIQVEAPPHKLELIYSDKNQKLNCDDLFFNHLKDTLLKAWKTAHKDVLVFLPGQREINRFRSIIQPLFPQYRIEILHGSLSLNEQKQIVRNDTGSGRRIILSTNVAESSITVSGVDCVIDSGLEKKSYRENKVGFSGLDLQRITLFSAKQRAGRAAREQAGYCFKLWHATDEMSMKEQIEPEILKTSLLEESLVLHQQEVTDIDSFSWLTNPLLYTIKQARQKLTKWNLITDKYSLTPLADLISKWPLSIENSILHYELSLRGFGKESAKLIAVLESGSVETVLEKNKNFNGSDVAKIIDSGSLDFSSERIYQQILSSCKVTGKNIPATDSFETTLIQIYASFFPEKVAFVRNKTNAVSMFGRGLQVSAGSQAAHSDFFIALAGRENHSQFTQVVCALGFDKKLAQEIFAPLARKQSEVHYDFEKNEFFKTEQLRFETFVLNDFGKSRLSSDELKKNWQVFFKKSPLDFLKIHPNYAKIKDRLAFLSRKDPGLSDESKQQIENFEDLLTDYIQQGYDSFEDYKNCDLFYLSYQVLNDELSDLMQNLPDSVKSNRGRSHDVDYKDDKAPMISLKIQDAFGWKDTPKICHSKFTLTLELLAPNMRPAQITSQLGLFWKSSYTDVRKDLRARYPKHDWPEDPSV
ncbi:MAG: ATP-dependent helicase C-terminal domain-containing protein [Bdellovibrionota bacterium]